MKKIAKHYEKIDSNHAKLLDIIKDVELLSHLEKCG